MKRLLPSLLASASLLAVTAGPIERAEAAPAGSAVPVAGLKVERTGTLVEVPGNPQGVGAARLRSFQIQLTNGTLVGLDRAPEAKARALVGSQVRAWGTDKGGRIDVGAGGLEAAAGAVDATAPSAPTSLRASVDRAGLIKLTWTASKDNVGVASYQISRTNKAWSVTSPGATDRPGKGTWVFTVTARDAAGNVSGAATVTAV